MEPLPIANPNPTKIAMAANFIQVAMFCSVAARRSPTTFTQVITAIATSATSCPRVGANGPARNNASFAPNGTTSSR